MYRRKNRLNSKEVKRTLSFGHRKQTEFFNVFYTTNPEQSKISFVVPKKLQKIAAQRNKTKRRFLNSLQKQTTLPKNTQIVLVLKKNIEIDKQTTQKLVSEASGILKEMGGRVESFQ